MGTLFSELEWVVDEIDTVLDGVARKRPPPPADQPSFCPIESSVVRPQLERLSRDVNAAHNQIRDHGTVIEKLLLWRDESSRRITLLEHSAFERGEAFSELKREVELMGVRVNGEFQTFRDRLDRITGGQEALIVRFDLHANEMKETALHATKEHEKITRRWVTVAYAIGALVAVLMAIYGAITGEPILTHIQTLLP